MFTSDDYERGAGPDRLPVLMSYAYLRDPQYEDVFASILDDPRIELLVDSGGFSALNAGHEIDLDAYIAWLDRYEEHLFGYMQLDVLGDPEASDAYLRQMIAAGLDPIPIHVWGDDEARMDELFELSGLDWVALGGLRRPQRGWAPKSYVVKKMEWAKGRRVHWLGYTKKSMVQAIAPYSMDASNAKVAYQWGEAHFYHGRGRWSKAFTKRKAKSAGKKRRGLLTSEQIEIVEACGYTAEDFYDPEALKGHDGNVLAAVTMYSHVAYSLDLKVHNGTRYFLALQPTDYTKILDETLTHIIGPKP